LAIEVKPSIWSLPVTARRDVRRARDPGRSGVPVEHATQSSPRAAPFLKNDPNKGETIRKTATSAKATIIGALERRSKRRKGATTR
jgi:hypothetical protein